MELNGEYKQVQKKDIEKYLLQGFIFGRLKTIHIPWNKGLKTGTGSNNSNAKYFLFISPYGEEFIIHGELIKFCKLKNLSIWMIYKQLKERIEPHLKHRNFGWKVKRI